MRRFMWVVVAALSVAMPVMAQPAMPELPGLVPVPLDKPYHYGGRVYSAAEVPVPFSAWELDPRGVIPVPKARPKTS